MRLRVAARKFSFQNEIDESVISAFFDLVKKFVRERQELVTVRVKTMSNKSIEYQLTQKEILQLQFYVRVLSV